MAIRDLLWACPLCGGVGGIRPAGRRERCSSCGATFQRGTGATIVITRDGLSVTRPAAEWLGQLGEPPTFEPHPDGMVFGPEPTTIRLAEHERELRSGTELLGFIEVFGPSMTGELSLTAERLLFRPAPDSATARGLDWPLTTVTAVQPASSSLQIAAGSAVAAIRFPSGSVRLWTRALQMTLKRLYAALGRDVLEFQPVLRSRPVRVDAGQ